MTTIGIGALALVVVLLIWIASTVHTGCAKDYE